MSNSRKPEHIAKALRAARNFGLMYPRSRYEVSKLGWPLQGNTRPNKTGLLRGPRGVNKSVNGWGG